MNRRPKWTPPSPSQEFKKICAAEDLQVIKDYAKAGDPAAIAKLKEIREAGKS